MSPRPRCTDSDAWQAWEHICNASRKEFQAIYDRLGVTNIWRGESFYNPLLAPLVEEMEQAGISEDSEGAKVLLCPLLTRCRRILLVKAQNCTYSLIHG